MTPQELRDLIDCLETLKSAYLLPWNDLAYFATRVGTDIAGTAPGIGHGIVGFMRGGNDVTGATLTRLFGAHGAILPGIATALLGLPLLLIQRHGMRVPTRRFPEPPVAPLCATCHSDAAYMKGLDPQVRVYQYAQYLTSTHGKLCKRSLSRTRFPQPRHELAFAQHR